MLRYDVDTRTAYYPRDTTEKLGLPAVMANVPDSLIERGYLATESVADFRRFHQDMLDGKREGSCVVRFKNVTGSYNWYAADYTLLFDEQGLPLHAIVSYEDVSDLREKELAYEKWQQNYKALPNESINYYEYNLTRDTFDREEGGMLPRVPPTVPRTLSAMALYTAENYAFPDDFQKFLEFYSRNRLLDCYNRGIHGEEMECRRQGCEEGQPLWTLASVQLVPDPYSSDVKGFILLKDIDAQKREELLISARSKQDPLTGLLNRMEFESEMSALLQRSKFGALHAVIIVDVDNFKAVNDTLGHVYGDQVLVKAAKNLRSMLRSGDLVGRLGGDEFVLCLRDVPYEAVVEKRVQYICQMLKKPLREGIEISGSLGVALFPRDGASFSELYQNADIALYRAKSQGRGRYVFFSRDMHPSDWKPAVTSIDNISSQAVAEAEKNDLLEDILRKNTALLRCQADDERYRVIMEHIGAAIFDWNAQTNSYYRSPRLSKYALHKLSDSALFSRWHSRDVVHPDDMQLIDHCYDQVCALGEGKVEVTVRLKLAKALPDVAYKWCRITFICIQDACGGMQRVIGIVNEVDFARQSVDIQLMALLTHIVGGVALLEVGTDIRPLYVRPSYHDLTGCAPQETADEQHFWEQVREEDRQRLQETLREGSKSGALVDTTYRCVSQRGVAGWRQLRAERIPYADTKYTVLLAVITDITRQKQLEQDLDISEQRFHIAFEQTDACYWEVDVATRTLYQSAASAGKYMDNMRYVPDMPESILRKGVVHPDSLEECRRFYAELYTGKKQGSCFLRVREATGRYIWVKTSFTMVYNAQGQPVKAIGNTVEMQDLTAAKKCFEQEELFWQAMRNELLAGMKANLKQDRIQALWRTDQKHPIDIQGWNYEKALEQAVTNTSNNEERCILRSRSNRKALLAAYEKGNHWISTEYRRRDSQGNLRWATNAINILVEPLSGDLYAFGYLRDIDQRKKWELSLARQVEKDPVTGLYTLDTTRALVSKILDKTQDRKALCALVLVDIQELNAMREADGIGAANNTLFGVGRLFRLLLDDKNVVGRVEDDRIAVFLPSVESEEWTVQKVRDLIATLESMRFAYNMQDKLRFVAGIVVYPVQEAGYSYLYANAAQALLQGRQQRVHSQFALYRPMDHMDSDGCKAFLGQNTRRREARQTSTSAGEVAKGDICAVVLRGMSDMLAAELLEEAMWRILAVVGGYYQADRTFVAELDEASERFSLPFCWRHPRIDPEKGEHAQKESRGFRIAPTALADRQPMLLEDLAALQALGPQACRYMRELGIQRLYLVPFGDDGSLRGFFGAANPSTHLGDAQLLCALLPFVLGEMQRRRLQARQTYYSVHDMLTGAKDRNGYLEFMENMDEYALSSLGVVSFDINGLKHINQQFGSVAGDKVVCLVAQALHQQFAPEEVFRYSGDEFLVLCRNVTCEAFVARARAARKQINGARENCVSMGYTWADCDIRVTDMIAHAQERMILEKQSLNREGMLPGSKTIRLTRYTLPEEVAGTQAAIDDSWFQVHLQPIVDVQTGQVRGAEALSRLQHPVYGVLSPAKFIPRMERSGLLPMLDLHVFQSVLALLDGWNRQGKAKELAISLNFSRSTMLSEGLLESLSNYCNRYPEISLRRIHIEITETLGDVEQELLVDIGAALSQRGFVLSLDDFGSQYSSLAMITAMPFDAIKLDKSLINTMVSNRRSRAMVESIVSTCRKMKVASIAEGVEREEQWSLLKALGCDYAQGYLFGAPLFIVDFEERYLKD